MNICQKVLWFRADCGIPVKWIILSDACYLLGAWFLPHLITVDHFAFWGLHFPFHISNILSKFLLFFQKSIANKTDTIWVHKKCMNEITYTSVIGFQNANKIRMTNMKWIIVSDACYILGALFLTHITTYDNFLQVG